MKIVKKVILSIFLLGLIGILLIIGVDLHVSRVGQRGLTEIDLLEEADAIIVLGAKVHSNGQVSRMLKDRLDMGFTLYEMGVAPKIVVSGDHGSKTYNEVQAMADYLEHLGVPPEDIFLDHAGFNTYDSMYRLKHIFIVNRAVVVSQEYHVLRANYIGQKLGLEVQGIGADTYVYQGMRYYRFRELGARVKAFWMAGVTQPKSTFLGAEIPITESGLKTRD